MTFDEKDEDVPMEAIPVNNFTLKKLSEIFHDIENTKEEMLEADPNLERSMDFHQGIQIMFSPWCKVRNENKEANIAQTPLYKFLLMWKNTHNIKFTI